MKPFCWISLCVTLVFAVLVSGCDKHAATDHPLRIGTNVWPGYEPLYLARSQGYFDNTPIHLVEFNSATEVIRAYRNGAIEAAALTMDEVLLLEQNKLEPQVVLVMDFSNGADVILGQPGINNIKGLTGKRVGVESTALGAYTLSRALSRHDMTPLDIEIVQLPLNEHEEAFTTGKVDAVVSFEPVKTRLLKAGAKQLFSSSEIPGEIVDVLVVRKRYLQQHPDAVRTLTRQWFKSLAYLHKYPRQAADAMALRLGISPDELLVSFKEIHIPDQAENRQWLGGATPGLLDTTKRLEQIMSQHRLIQRPVASNALFYPGAL